MAYIRWFREITEQDRPLIGSKNVALGILFQLLRDKPTPMPDGFVVTSHAYQDLLADNDLPDIIREQLTQMDAGDLQALNTCSHQLRQRLLNARFPPALERQLRTAYRQLCGTQCHASHLVVRASATLTGPDGDRRELRETHLNIRGKAQLLDCCRKVYSGLFTTKALAEHLHHQCPPQETAIFIAVQSMVRADRGSAGTLTTADTESGFANVMEIHAAYGLGENVIEGSVIADRFWLFKPSLKQRYRPVIKRQLGRKGVRLVALDKSRHGIATQNEAVPPEWQHRFAVSDDDLLQLGRSALALEAALGERHETAGPWQLEWAKDGLSGKLSILQATPLNLPQRQPTQPVYRLLSHGERLLSGQAIGQQIASGTVRVITDPAQLLDVRPGEILVAEKTDPQWEPALSAAAAIITSRGEQLCHAAMMARQLDIPALVGCEGALERLHTGQRVTVSGIGGSGAVYDGKAEYRIDNEPVAFAQRPRTGIMLNVADPHCAFMQAALPNDGVGLARLEHIIRHWLGIHPAAILDYAEQPKAVRREIEERSYGYHNPQHFYVERLAEGIGTIAAAFYPKPVILRFSDFKSNEYRELIGGEEYEPHEANPLLGFRGTARYPTPRFAHCFAMECRAVTRVRQVMGLDNLMLMLPFVRTPEELDTVLQMLSEYGLQRGTDGLKIYIMCELPANVLLADAFLERCDGFSIGTNDLTQLVLGIDRGSSLLRHYDERNPAVKKMIASAIASCHRHHKAAFISGRAPSDYPDLTRWLVEQHADAISFAPASVVEMTRVILALEEELEHS